ncbi:hypothetical protein ACN38_g2360 [Penicillium nordicum]|uniref:Uncharacterized protein n=1 Tax=Penicillium nordicum TaxID=229535 RepID=A0A0M9WJ00_9EURO|nr:hypothetical protein ACN38_g2360 [Penicillium nordicum]
MAKPPPLLRRVIWHRNVSSGSATVKLAWICHIPRTWRRREVAERRPFLASPAAEKGSQIAKRNSYLLLVEF